jgi:CRISPR-associated protein Csx10
LARVHSRRAAQAVLEWINHLNENVRRRDKWPDEAINCVREILTNPQKIWEILEVEQFHFITDNALSELKNDLWPYAVRTFFDACVRAHKRDLEARSVQEENIHGS